MPSCKQLVFASALSVLTSLGLVACSDSKQAKKSADQGAQSDDGTLKDSEGKTKKKSTAKETDEGETEQVESEDGEGTISEDETVVGPDAGTATPAPDPGSKPALQVIYRLWKGDHLYSTDRNEGVAGGYAPEGPVFNLLQTAEPGTGPMMRCRTATGVHFLSLDQACEGQIVEGIIGHVLAAQLPNTIPLVRCHNPVAAGVVPIDFVVVLQEQCGPAGYTVQGPMGFAPTEAFER